MVFPSFFFSLLPVFKNKTGVQILFRKPTGDWLPTNQQRHACQAGLFFFLGGFMSVSSVVLFHIRKPRTPAASAIHALR